MQPRQNSAYPSTRAQWRSPLAIATAAVAAVALGAVGISGTLQPAAADVDDDSEGQAELIHGSVLEGLDADELADLAAAVRTASGNPSDPGPSDADIDLGLLADSLTVDIGSVTLPLIGNGQNNGLLVLGPNAEAGLLNGYASSPSAQESVAASGALGADGAINVDAGGSGTAAALDLTGLLGQLGLAELTDDIVDQAALQLGALAARADQDTGGVTTEYLLADAQVQLHSPLLAGLAGTVQTEVGTVEGSVNQILGPDGTVQGLLDTVTIEPVVLGVGPVDLARVDFGAPTVAATVDLSEVTDDLLTQPLTDENGIVTLDPSTGTIAIDLAALHAGNLNNLDPNTNLLTTEQVDQVTQAITGLLDDLLDNVVSAVDDALLGTDVTVDLHPSVTLLGGALGEANVGATLTGTLGDFLGLTGTDPELDVTGSVSLNLLLTELELNADQLFDILEPVIVAVLGDIGAAFDGLLNADTSEGAPAIGLVAALQSTLSALLDDLDVLNPLLNQLLTITVNNQPSPGDLGAESTTVRALSVALLPNALDGVVLDLASATVRAAAAPPDADEYTPAYAETPATVGVPAVSDEPTFTDAGGAGADAPEGTTFDLAEGAPADATIDPDTGVITWTPAVEDAGQQVTIPVVVTYPDGSTDEVNAPFQVATVTENLTPAYTDTPAEVGVPAVSDEPTFTDADDADVDAPEGTTFALDADAPEGAQIDGDTGVITWTASPADADTTVVMPVVVTYPDGSTDTVDALFQVGLPQAAELSPEYTDTAAQVGVEATSDVPTFTDADGADVDAPAGTTFALDSDAPEGAQIDGDTGVITWTPGLADAGSTVDIPVVVTYPDGSFDEVVAPFVVASVTEAYTPAYAETPATVGVPAVSDEPTFTDAGGAGADAPEGTTFDLAEGAPADATIDPDTGVITWTPAVEDAGQLVTIPVVVTYPDGSTDQVDAPFQVQDYNGNASASAAASANADDESNASAEAAAQAAANDDATSTASAAADVDATAAAASAADVDASAQASTDVDSDANASAAAAAQAAANADATSATNADASAAATAEADADANAASAAAAEAASTADSSAAASADATANGDADVEGGADPEASADDDTQADANTNASASAAASANADDDSNAAAEAAAQAAANDDATSTASAAADVDATAAASSAANADASSAASADVDTDANASAAAAAQAAANADATSASNADASAAATAEADADANAASAAAAEAASTADSSAAASADASSSANASSAADGSQGQLQASVRFERIVRGTGVVQEVYGSGFAPGESVTATVHSTPFDLTATANSDGEVTLSFEVDSDFELGEHTVVLVGQTSGEVPEASSDTDFVVVAPGQGGGVDGSGSGADGSGSGGGLPGTGADLNPGLLIGALLLVLIGGGLAAGARFRRRGRAG